MVIDYVGSLPDQDTPEGEEPQWTPFAGGEGRDQLVELGGGNLIEGFEEGLLGASAGEERTLDAPLPGRVRQRRPRRAATRPSR